MTFAVPLNFDEMQDCYLVCLVRHIDIITFDPYINFGYTIEELFKMNEDSVRIDI